jgi:hypothetical protein
MAQIYFSNLVMDLTHELDDINKFEAELNNLYKKYESEAPEVFSNFRPIIVSPINYEVEFNEKEFINWENEIPYTDENKYKFAFILQGGDGLTKEVNWGKDIEGIFDDSIGTFSRTFNSTVSHFTNDLMRLLGEYAEINFYFSVSGSGFSEDYHIMLETNNNENYPLVSFDAELQ